MSHPLLLNMIACSFLLSSCSFSGKNLSNTPEFHSLPPLKDPVPQYAVDSNLVHNTDYRPQVNCPTSKCMVFPYDFLLWNVGKHVGIRTKKINGQRDTIFLDTGIYDYTRVPLNVVIRRNLPIKVTKWWANNKLNKSTDVYFDTLSLGDLEFRGLFGKTEDTVYDINLLGMPIYKYRVITMGTPDLRAFKYVKFDNPRKQVTFGIDDKFIPDPQQKWEAYDILTEYSERSGVYVDRPNVNVKMNNQPFKMLFDSGAGPTIIFTRRDWDRLKGHVDINSETSGHFPTWGGSKPMDIYEISSLTVGEREFTDLEVWVRKIEKDEQGNPKKETLPSIFGLGVYYENTVVYDFEHNKAWISH